MPVIIDNTQPEHADLPDRYNGMVLLEKRTVERMVPVGEPGVDEEGHVTPPEMAPAQFTEVTVATPRAARYYLDQADTEGRRRAGWEQWTSTLQASRAEIEAAQPTVPGTPKPAATAEQILRDPVGAAVAVDKAARDGTTPEQAAAAMAQAVP